MNFFELFPFTGFVLFLILLFGRILMLNKKGIKVNSKSSKKGKAKFILYPVFLFIFLIWISEISRPLFHLSVLPENLTTPIFSSLFTSVLGAVLLICALFFWGVTLIHFQKSLRFGMNSKNPGPLIKTGIFSVSRNPFFISIELLFIGIALLLPGIFLICFTLTAIVSIHFFILKEEKFMHKNYGEEYQQYIKNVRRYF